ncbi:MAG: patatin-like phospholipase family protein [Burkholderiaceae bacterium]
MTTAAETAASSTSSLHHQLLEATLKEIFGEIEPDFLAQVMPLMTTVDLPATGVLIRQGDPSDAIYLVLSGRLRASVREDAGTVVLGDIGRGEPIGEMGVISKEPRSATITALRDCLLLKLSAEHFTQLLQTWPKVALPLARKLISRLSKSNRPVTGQKHHVNVCVVPLQAGLDAQALGRRLLAHLAAQRALGHPHNASHAHPMALITRESIDAALGPGAADAEASHASEHHRLLAWLDAQEMQHAMQVLVADTHDSAWTRLCLRHADHVLLAAQAEGPSDMTELERRQLTCGPCIAATQSLWLLHPDTEHIPRHTRRWLDARPHIAVEGLSHFHTRLGHDGDWARLARIMCGQATGLVLAGGGARGFAQLGIMQELQARGIEWDLAGGTSIGAVMAAYAAMDLPMQRVIPQARAAFSANPTSDVNWLPLISVMRGVRLAQVIRNAIVHALGTPVNIEDLWKPYFCVVSNYSRGQMQVLRLGDLATSVTASVSIPAALPPVLWQGDLLTDGGTFNNYPVDIMRASGAARVIGVDMGRDSYQPLTFPVLPSGFALFFDRFLRPRKRRRYQGLPGLASIVFNVAAMASKAHEKRMRKQVDLAFMPDVSGIGMLEWKAFDKVVAIGRAHAQQRLAPDGAASTPPPL